jgi:hypothetical protein
MIARTDHSAQTWMLWPVRGDHMAVKALKVDSFSADET